MLGFIGKTKCFQTTLLNCKTVAFLSSLSLSKVAITACSAQRVNSHGSPETWTRQPYCSFSMEIPGKSRKRLGIHKKNILQCCNDLVDTFLSDTVSDPRASAEYIMAYVLGYKTLHGVSPYSPVGRDAQRMIIELAEKRLSGLPIQYVLGEWDFRDLTLICRPPVFVPRPETEELVGYALADIVLNRATQFLEIGSGTGAISLSLLTECSDLRSTVIELNPEACKLTRENAEKCGVLDRINIICAEFSKDFDALHFTQCKFDFLISNPPYISTEDMKHLQPEVSRFEDHQALHGGPDGMKVIRDILQLAPFLVKLNGSVWLEVDSCHPCLLQDFVNQNPASSLKYLCTYEDFCSRPRFCHLQVQRSS